MSAGLHGYWFFTAPHEPVLVRRGDPLGFRLVADYFADLLVPDLSNRSVDARWLTILCWALSNAERGWRHYDARDVAVTPSRDRQAARQLYDWIRPLELLWVARTLNLAGDDKRTRQLPGQRAVIRWLEDPSSSDFGLSADQRVRYRQTGAYGGYRVALKKLPGLTMAGDGWRLAEVGKQLAEIVNDKIAFHPPHFVKAKGTLADRNRFWLKHWEAWNADTGNDFFPESSAFDRVRKLPGNERKILSRVIFGGDDDDIATPLQRQNQRRRRQVSAILGQDVSRTHADLCEGLADQLSDVPDEQRKRVALLPSFTRLADAGVETMNAVWDGLEGNIRVPLAELATNADLANTLDELQHEASDFGKVSHDGLPGVEIVELFAQALQAANSPIERLRALVEHHQVSGGGMRWFVIDDDHLTRNAPTNPGTATVYRFRLWGLARLAVQCGQIAEMPQAFIELADGTDEGEDA